MSINMRDGIAQALSAWMVLIKLVPVEILCKRYMISDPRTSETQIQSGL